VTSRFFTIIFLIVGAIVIGWHYAANGETVPEWIHRTHQACCNHLDCVPVNARRVPAGWIIEWHGEMIPYNGPVAPSPAETTACGTPERIRCLFLSGGTS
jgi:hypothetical protein